MDLQTISQVSTIVLAIASLYLAWVALSFTAKPKIVATLLNARSEYGRGERVALTYLLRNAPRPYARPIATGVIVWVNLDQAFTPIRLKYGAQLERADEQVKKGKGSSKVLKAEDLILTVEELGENIELETLTPKRPGDYRIYLAIHTAEGGWTRHSDAISVK